MSCRSASLPRSSQVRRYISYSMGVSCPSCWMRRAKMALSAAMLRSVKRSPWALWERRMRQSWFMRVSKAQIWKEQAQRWGSRQQASRMLWAPMRCHSPMGSGDTTIDGMWLRSSCSNVDLPLPMLPSIEQTIFIVNFISCRTPSKFTPAYNQQTYFLKPMIFGRSEDCLLPHDLVINQKSIKYSAQYLLANSKPLSFHVAVPSCAVWAEFLVILLLFRLLPLALLRLHQVGQCYLLPQRYVEVRDEGESAEGLWLLLQGWVLPLGFEDLEKGVLGLVVGRCMVLADRSLLDQLLYFVPQSIVLTMLSLLALLLELGSIALVLFSVLADEKVLMTESVEEAGLNGLALLVLRPDGFYGVQAVFVLKEILREALSSS